MKIRISTLVAAACLLTAHPALSLDTSDPFLCAVTQVNECLDGFGCETVLPEAVNAPTFIWVDMKKKHIRTNHNSSGARVSSTAKLGNRHILHGASDGAGESVDGVAWTLSIEDTTGRFVGAIAIQQASISLFGACTELELD
jgi:hypothetical protein